MNLIAKAIARLGGPDNGGKRALAEACDVTYQAVNRWLARGYLPHTELTGKTRYAQAIARATRGKIPAKLLQTATRQGWQKAFQQQKTGTGG